MVSKKEKKGLFIYLSMTFRQFSNVMKTGFVSCIVPYADESLLIACPIIQNEGMWYHAHV